MYYDSVLMIYTFAIIFFPFMACLLIMFTMGRGKFVVATISVLSSVMSLFLSCTAVYIIFKNSNYSLLIDFPWITTQNNSLQAVFVMDKVSSLLMASASLVFTVVHLYAFRILNKMENNVLVKFFALNCLAHSLLMTIFASASLIQIYVFMSLLTVVIFLLRLVEKSSEQSVVSAKIEFITNISADMFLLLGTILLSNSLGTSVINQLYAHLSEGKFVNNTQALVAIFSIFIFLICKLGFFPFNLIFMKNSEDYPACFAEKVALYHTGSALFVLILIKPFCSVLPSVSIVAFIFWALLTALILVYRSIVSKNILHIAGRICFANNCLLAVVIASDLGLSSLFVLSISMLIITLLLIIVGYLMSVMHTIFIWETGNISKYMKLLLIACSISIMFLSGLPPLSGFWRNSAVFASVGDVFSMILTSVIMFFMAFSAMRLYTVIFFGKKESEIQAKNPPALISIMLTVFTLAIIILGNIAFPFLFESMGDYVNMRTSLSISADNFRMAFILSMSGVITGFLIYFKMPEKREDVIFSYLNFKNIFKRLKRSKN